MDREIGCELESSGSGRGWVAGFCEHGMNLRVL